MTLRAIVAEDEAPQRQALLDMLADAWPALEIVAACEDGPSALLLSRQNLPPQKHAADGDAVLVDMNLGRPLPKPAAKPTPKPAQPAPPPTPAPPKPKELTKPG